MKDTAMPERHSSIVGGSSAARVINCPGSAALLAQVPKEANRESFYSREGTVLHTLMELLITGKVTLDTLPPQIVLNDSVIPITASLIEDALRPAMNYWNDFLCDVDNWIIEAEVEFPGIEGAFGTCDVIGRDDELNITEITDWKFGSGKGVTAEYDGVPNEQLMFYACAAMNTYPEMFPNGCRVVLTIVQPRARDHEPITSIEVTLQDLANFAARLRNALARKETAPGRWCDFQPCKTICPHHTGPLLDLSDITPPTSDSAAYIETLRMVLNAAPIVEALIKEARAQAQLLMANGTDVEGWKLVDKRGTRSWAVPEEQLPKLLKIPKAALYETVLRSPAKVEKAAKIKVPAIIAPMVSPGVTIAPTHDKRPAISVDSDAISKIMIDVLGEDA
jgi:hypothetical protein